MPQAHPRGPGPTQRRRSSLEPTGDEILASLCSPRIALTSVEIIIHCASLVKRGVPEIEYATVTHDALDLRRIAAEQGGLTRQICRTGVRRIGHSVGFGGGRRLWRQDRVVLRSRQPLPGVLIDFGTRD